MKRYFLGENLQCYDDDICRYPSVKQDCGVTLWMFNPIQHQVAGQANAGVGALQEQSAGEI